jgi:MFS transporter, DHA1 family, tetracycline resistance protein
MTEAQPKGRKAAFAFVFVVSLINAVSFGIMIPVLPNLIKQFTGGDTAAASEWNVLFAVVWGATQFVCGPILGLLSDRVGRRPVLLISLFGLGIDFLFMAFAPTLMWLFVGRVLNGATAASFATANAYVADVTAPEQRAKAFGWLMSALSAGFLVGPALGGFLGEVDLRLPFMVAAGLTLANTLYGVFVLPESLPPERRTKSFDLSRANPLGSLRLLRAHPDLLGLAGIGFLYQLAHTVLPTIFVLYTGYRYGWTAGTMGLAMMGSAALSMAVQAALVGPAVARVGERGALIAGAACGAAGFAIFALAPTGWTYLLGMPVFALMGLLQPGLMGLMSRKVAPTEQGQLQGANQSLQGLASMAGPALFGLTFAWSIRHEASLHAPGLAIGLAAVLLALALVMGFGVARAPAEARAG